MSRSILAAWAMMAVCCLMAAGVAMGAEYHTSFSGSDANPGAADAPFRTIQRGVEACGAGDTLVVHAGVYHEVVEIQNSGKDGAPLTVRAAGDGSVVIDGEYVLPEGADGWTDPRTGNDMIWVPLLRIIGSHVVVEGLELTRSHGGGITVNPDTSHVVVRDCLIHDNRGNGIVVLETEDTLVEGCRIWGSMNFAPYSRSAYELDWGSSFAMRGCTRTTARGNTIFHNWGEGMTIMASDHLTIEDNVVYDNYAAGIYLERCSYSTVQRNLVYHTGDPAYYRGASPCPGIGFADETHQFGDTPQRTRNLTVVNNISIGHSQNLFWWGNLEGKSGLLDSVIANNTLVQAVSNSPEHPAIGLAIGPGLHTNARIENNIILQTSGKPADVVNDPNLHFSHNLWSQPVTGRAAGSGDVVADPKLANIAARLVPGEVQAKWYRPAEDSPAWGAGVPCAEASVDFLARSRDGRRDLGAIGPEALVLYVSPDGDDANPGTKALPWRTIRHAVNQLQGGETVYLGHGTYVEYFVIPPEAAGTVANPTVIRGIPGEPKPVLDGEYRIPEGPVDWKDPKSGNDMTWEPVIRVNASHLLLEGLEITRSHGGAITVGPDTTDNIIRDCHIHDNRGMGIYFYRNRYSLVENCEMSGAMDFAPYTRGAYELNWGGPLATRQCQYITFRGNTLHHNWGEGICAMSSDHLLIEDNVVYDNHSVNIYLERCSHSTVQRNLVYSTHDARFMLAGRPCAGIGAADETHNKGGTPQRTRNLQFLNNISIGHSVNLFWWSDSQGKSGLIDSLIANNTLIEAYNAPVTDGDPVGLSIQKGVHTNARIENNLVLQSQGAITQILVDDPTVRFSHNLWSQPVSGLASSPDDVVGDPKLVDPHAVLRPGEADVTAYEPVDGSPAVNAATPLAEAPVDFTGKRRDATPDIGAVEATYNLHYVSPEGDDTASGSFENPWRTIQHGVNQLRPGQTLYIRAGTYAEQVVVPPSASGRPEHRTRICGYPGEAKPVIDGQYRWPEGTSWWEDNPNIAKDGDRAYFIPNGETVYETTWGLLFEVQASYIDIENLVVERARGHGLGSWREPVEHVTYRGMEVRHIRDSAFLFMNSDYTLAEDSLFWDACNFAPFERSAGDLNWGALVGMAPNSDHMTFRRCTFRECWGEGVYVSKNNGVVENCSISDTWRPALYLEKTGNAVIRNNVIYATGKAPYPPMDGIDLAIESAWSPYTGNDCSGNQIYNNFIAGCRYNIVFWGENPTAPEQMDDNKVFNNTFVNGREGCVFIDTFGDPTGNEFYNNIFYQSEGPIIAADQARPGVHSFHHNLWSSTPPDWVGEEDSIIEDPKLVDANPRNWWKIQQTDNYKLTAGSPAIDAGAAQSACPTDYFGNPRKGRPDIGAHEFGVADADAQ